LPPTAALQSRAIQESPQLRAQRAAVEGRYLGVESARRDYYPDFELMGGYFNQGSMRDMWEFRIQLNIPVYFWQKQRPALEESVLRLTEARRVYRAQEQMLAAAIQERYLAAEAARKLMDLYSKLIVPQSNLALESSLLSYETGALDFTAVLANFLTILEYEMKFYEQQAEYLKSLAGLEELVGGAL
jgi:outer membrane protein TolC